jgi:GrpB-like predicted nucleotidyltransferase (UPF0157 family)
VCSADANAASRSSYYRSMIDPRRLIEIVAYQERWVAEFVAIGSVLRAALGAIAVRIDHIGSTSVQSLGAKDVIDVQITVAALEPSESLAAALAHAGYTLRPEITDDHRPPGDALPAAEWQKRYAREPLGARRTHVHVREAGRANQRYALLFRDFLRADRLARASYEGAKRALARLHPHDIDAYLEVKDPICDALIAGAEVWAAATGWYPGPSDA